MCYNFSAGLFVLGVAEPTVWGVSCFCHKDVDGGLSMTILVMHYARHSMFCLWYQNVRITRCPFGLAFVHEIIAIRQIEWTLLNFTCTHISAPGFWVYAFLVIKQGYKFVPRRCIVHTKVKRACCQCACFSQRPYMFAWNILVSIGFYYYNTSCLYLFSFLSQNKGQNGRHQTRNKT